jgi:coproporphyrinogen III oxidase
VARAFQLPPSIFGSASEAAGHSFYATGIHGAAPQKILTFRTSVHPLNYRYFEARVQCEWFGGGIDLTPFHPVEEDVVHFHKTLKKPAIDTIPEYYI